MDVHTQLKNWLGSGSINIFGRPFAGKDTQAQRLAAIFDAHILGGGDILRNSKIPQHVDEALRRGELIPSQDYVEIVLPYLSRLELAGKPLVLSSVGRWIGEEAGVIAALQAANHPLMIAVYLEISEDTVKQRWQSLGNHDDRGGRYDDTLEILENRLKEYREKTLPVIDEYNHRGLLLRIDGEHSPKEVEQMIVDKLRKLAGYEETQ